MTTLQDIIKKGFLELENFAGVQLTSVVISLLVSLVVAMFIFFIYKRCYRGVLYSYTFNMTLAMMTIITSMIIVTVSSNIVLSLGMVGALSIVRFRTAIKDPIDLMFLFWAVAAGIATGAQLYPIVVVGNLTIGIVFLVLSRFKTKKLVYLLVINYENDALFEINKELTKFKYIIRSKMVRKDVTELTIEIQLKDQNTRIVNAISEIDGVINTSLVSYNGDFAQ